MGSLIMGKARFLYQNLISSESMLAVSSLKTGTVSTAQKAGIGSAILNPSGDYSGTTDLEYTVECDSIAGGAEVGQATFKWGTAEGIWTATGVLTSATNILLSNGVYINFVTGGGADFVVGDKWYFKAINLFSAGKMIDMDRDHVYQSAALGAPNTVTVTLDAEALVDALMISDHNFTSAATIELWGDDAATFNSDGGTAQVVESITWASGKILHYLTTADRTKKYWQLRVSDAANPDGYIEIGDLFIGPYLELTRNFSEGFSNEPEFLMDTSNSPSGIERDRFHNERLTFNYDFMVLACHFHSPVWLLMAQLSPAGREIL